MKIQFNPFRRELRSHSLLVATLGLLLTSSSSFSAEITLTPGTINNQDTTTASYTDSHVTLTPFIGNAPSTFNASAVRLGIDGAGTNDNAFNDPDTDPANGNEEKLQMEFEANAGLTSISWDFSRADGPGPNDGVIISGFSADPAASTSGAGTLSTSYDAATGTLKLQITNGFVDADGTLTLANPAASAGQTLTMAVTDTTQAGAQLAITSFSYEDDVPANPPVIAEGLPAETSTFEGVVSELSITLEPGAFPTPSYLWEVNMGSGFVTAPGDATSPIYSFTAGPTANGTYRVTVSGGGSSVSSQTVVTSVDDGDNLPNQWEIDNFGDLSQGDSGDPDGDNLSNLDEFNASTDPNNPDTDGDGLNDGDEIVNNADPLLVDTDGDGFYDGYEVANGSAPNDPDDAPLSPSGRNSIGITFSSPDGQAPGVNLTSSMVAGAPGYEQKNWNILPAATGNVLEESVTAPIPGRLADSNGNEVPDLLFTSDSSGSFSLLFNQEQTIGGLLSGYLFADPNDLTMSIFLEDIPYPRYDIVVYPVAFSGRVGRVIVGEVEATPISVVNEYTLSTTRIYQNGEDPVWSRSLDRSNFADNSSENYPEATHVVFQGLEGPNATIELLRVVDNGGIAAIQIVESIDSDGDGMGDVYELEVGLDPNDGSPTSPTQGANGDFDNDTISNIDEYYNGTNPTLPDTDGDGYNDNVESDTGIFVDASDPGTDPRIADTDGDGLLDGVETGTGVFVSASDTGTNPLVFDLDADGDGYSTAYEMANGSDPFSISSPGGPNPNGFAIAFNSVTGTGGNVDFTTSMFAGAPGVEQMNWNRSIDLENNIAAASGDIAKIGTPNAGQIIDSSGNVIGNGATGVGVDFAAGSGAWSTFPDNQTPYGRLFNSFIFGRSLEAGDNPDATVSLTGIPYGTYDAYVYFGSEVNGRRGTIAAAGTTYSFTTAVVPAAGEPGSYLETSDTANGFPQANYAVFRGLSGESFDVTTTVNTNNFTLGIFGVQIVEAESGPVLVLENPARTGTTFTADFITNTAGEYQLERSLTLDGDWTSVGASFTASAGTTPVSDPSAPAGKAFYRVSAQ
ncbi:hypothetical protein AAFN60_08870 [Roseibacillus persicicus]|uniref:hypothetical protein n=1 Tax=Roseibacillus persicicus TaxID=454148 RepID=UPI00398B73A5